MTISENTRVAPAFQQRPRHRRKAPLTITRERRKRMEAIVDSLVTLLDELDGDADSEPSLAGYPMPGYAYDAEGEDDSGIADQDGLTEQVTGEPSLGWTGEMNQTRAMRKSVLPWSTLDGEAEHDGREPDADMESSPDEEYDARDAPRSPWENIDDQRAPNGLGAA